MLSLLWRLRGEKALLGVSVYTLGKAGLFPHLSPRGGWHGRWACVCVHMYVLFSCMRVSELVRECAVERAPHTCV